MRNKITKITEKIPKIATLPDGFYNGMWEGYTIEVVYQGKTFELITEEGIRGIGFKVIVKVKDGVVTLGEINS